MRYVVSMLLVCGAVGTAVVLYLTQPKARKARPVKPAPLVRTVPLDKTSEPVVVEAFGTVVAAKELTLQAEVGGRIIHLEPNLVVGGLVPEGRTLLQIDPADYRLEVRQREADVKEAQFEAELEQGRGFVAQREWELLAKEVVTSQAGRRLALREPHRERAASRVQGAEAALAKARLAEERTALSSPFNALVVAESVEAGQLVAEKTTLATLVGTDQFWVQLSVPLAKLSRLALLDNGNGGPPAKVILDTGNGESMVRRGRVLRLLGDLDPDGRMARVLVAIDNPLDLPPPSAAARAASQPARMGPRRVLLGSYVKVEIDAGVEPDVYVVPRLALREGDRLWLVGGDRRLRFRDAEVLWRRRQAVLVRAEVQPDERLIVSRLRAPLPGVEVRVEAPTTATAPASAPSAPGGA
ncbi:MAG TPA: HlyD family efflux transporter periplasmic adaptor subunit [Phycisphaerae bacterium]|nr:HlyD family efflux transporter periplasmic adaptor subunit [Phycisphaerae bacterium]